jgi:uncharacterized repeat protein (TIGR02543 family)
MIVVAVIAVAAVCIAAAAIILSNNENPNAIRYHLDGGEFVDDYPKNYDPGVVLEIPNPVKHGYVFHGWYTDDGFVNRFDGSTSGIQGALDLYAQWGDVKSGNWLVYDINGTRDAGMESYVMEGTEKLWIGYYSEGRGAYNVAGAGVLTIDYTELDKDSMKLLMESYWMPEMGSFKKVGHETIPTVEGNKECDIMENTVAVGDTWKFWINDSWIPYKIVHNISSADPGSVSEAETIYELTEKGFEPIPGECEVTVVESGGVKVSGNKGTYDTGSLILLTAEADKEKGFGGWYDGDMKLLGTEPTLKYEITADLTVYALNAQEFDAELEPGTEVNLKDLFHTDGDSFLIENADTGDKAKTDDGKYTFYEGGLFLVKAYIDGEVKKIFHVKVDGTVIREFIWDYDGKTYSLKLEMDYRDVDYARKYYAPEDRKSERPEHERDKTFVTMSYTDPHMAPYIEGASDSLITSYKGSHSTVDEYDFLNYLLVFTQNIHYEEDKEYTGYDEYWKFPLETLYDQGGDCEDTSLLFLALAHECSDKLGFENRIALQILPQHAAAAVMIEDMKDYDPNPYGFIFGETTATGYDLGEIPGKVKNEFLEEKYYSGLSVTVEIE